MYFRQNRGREPETIDFNQSNDRRVSPFFAPLPGNDRTIALNTPWKSIVYDDLGLLHPKVAQRGKRDTGLLALIRRADGDGCHGVGPASGAGELQQVRLGTRRANLDLELRNRLAAGVWQSPPWPTTLRLTGKFNRYTQQRQPIKPNETIRKA